MAGINNRLTQKKIENVIDSALATAALGEPYEFFVSFTFAPPVDEQGMPQMGKPYVPTWWVQVSIRNNLVGQSDLAAGFPVNGMRPDNEMFKFIAAGLLAKCRLDREQNSTSPQLDQARAAFQKQMEASK